MMSPAKPAKRQSCDRYHAQKLRCSRQGSGEGGICTRCFRQSAECVYSTSLPKGRPNTTHRLAGAGVTSLPAVASAPTANMTTETTTTNSTPCHIDVDFTSALAATPSTHTTMSAMSSSPATLEHDLATEPLPSPLDDWSSELDPFWPCGWINSEFPADALTTNSTNLNPTTACINTAKADSAASSSSSTSTSTSASSSAPPSSDPDACVATATQACVTQLSELLSYLSSAFTLAQQGLIGPLVTDVAFDTVATLLISANPPLPLNPSPACSTLRVAFLGTQRLLDILHRLRLLSKSDLPAEIAATAIPTPSASSGSLSLPPPPPYNSGSIIEHPQQSRYASTVIHHIVLACHNLLLNIYDPFLFALQHDAASTTGQIDDPLAQARVDTRLVMLVQLSSYFIQRLHKSVKIYFSQTDGDETRSGSTSLQTIVNLEARIQQKLVQLQQELHI